MYGLHTFTVLPFMVALLIGVAAMPTNVFQICAWNVGTLAIEPWRTKGDKLLGRLIARRDITGVLVLLLAIGALTLLWYSGSGELALANLPVLATLQSERARLLTEIEGLRNDDGQFRDDAARAAFDERMERIETLDEQIESHADSRHDLPDNPMDPGAPRQTPEQIAERQQNETERGQGTTAERERVAGILAAVRNAGFAPSFAERLINDGTTLLRAQQAVLEELSRRDAGGPRAGGFAPRQSWGGRTGVEGPDPVEHIRGGVENALLHRVHPTAFKLNENGRQYAHTSLIDMAKYCLHARGVRTTGMSKMQIAGMSLGLNTRGGFHTTSDFADVLANVANKTLRRAYDEAPATFAAISRQVTLPDFRPVNRLQIGEAPQLLKVLEHGEYTRGTLGQGKEQYQLGTYGRVFAITRQALVNDDTESFSRIAMLFGRAARDLEANLIWEQITGNPTMGDGITLFHASHGNLAGAGAAIDVTTVGAGRSAMRQQKGLDGAMRLNIVPKFLIVPTAKETIADQFVAPLTAAQTSAVNPFSNKLTVIAEPRLDAVSGVSWYLAAGPEQVDIVEYAYLEGESGPIIETRVGFDVDGVETKCRHDFAAKVLDWRGLYKNPGA